MGLAATTITACTEGTVFSQLIHHGLLGHLACFQHAAGQQLDGPLRSHHLCHRIFQRLCFGCLALVVHQRQTGKPQVARCLAIFSISSISTARVLKSCGAFSTRLFGAVKTHQTDLGLIQQLAVQQCLQIAIAEVAQPSATGLLSCSKRCVCLRASSGLPGHPD